MSTGLEKSQILTINQKAFRYKSIEYPWKEREDPRKSSYEPTLPVSMILEIKNIKFHL